ncbi:uncharacterized protein isoform X5 [Leptinotarsa decemlineata]|uniref:uncharacterized protein isoform X5 n=1 Tax=Leptinotarsa decemlineata TaxID=7539 RepID=UPI003D30A4C9
MFSDSKNWMLISFCIVELILIYYCFRLRLKLARENYPNREVTAHQQEDIFNISSRVQGQEQWPTHEAHLSIDHINIMNELNKPPSYQDDAPPSYEEAMRLAAAKQQGESSSVAVIVVAPKPSTTN